MATWRRQDKELSQVVEEAECRALELNRMAISVVRLKVEASPTNEEVPQDDDVVPVHAAGAYFEHHVKLLRDQAAPSEALLRACEQCGAHLSRNAFREVGAGQEERFVTLRSYGVGWRSSERQLRQLRAVLQGLGEQIIEQESEYCVYDSNIGLDAGWLGRLT